MFTLYCDDSGTHAQSPIAAAACFVSTVEQWERFVIDWRAADDAEGFGVFHMADFVAKQKQFSREEWQDEEKRDRTLKRLINIAVTRRRIAFIAAVEKSSYDEVVPSELRDKFKLGTNHYTFAIRMCMGKVYKWRQKYGYKEPVQYVFDQMSKGKGEINAVFEEALKEGEEKALLHGIYKGGWSFQDKAQVTPLQASDILAWESLRYVQKVYLPEPRSKEAPRKSYIALTEGPTDLGYHSRETLRNLIAAVQEKLRAKGVPEHG